MIDFEHGALRRKGEPELAGIVAHSVIDHCGARAVSFLNGAALLDQQQWDEIIDAEVRRRRTRRPALDRAVRRLQALLVDDADSWIHRMLSGYVDEIGYSVRREYVNVSERTYSAITGMLTVASLAILYIEKIDESHLALIYEPFEPFVPLASLG